MEHGRTAAPPKDLEVLFARYRDRGDSGAIAAVYDRTAVELLTVATHLCSEPADAEDAVQATFLTALESADSWQPSRPLMPWLLGILTNRVRRQRRAARREPEPGRLRSGGAAAPSAALEAHEFTRAVDEQITRLPATYQPVLVLRLKHGMSPADIAHALRRPPATVRAQLSRGLELLRRALPASFAAALAVASLPTQGLAAVRALVLERARDLAGPAASPGGSPAAAPAASRAVLRTVGLAVAAVLVGATAFLLSAPAGPTTDPLPELLAAEVAATTPGKLQPAPPLPAPETTREPVATGAPTGLELHLRHAGAPAPDVPVRIEFLGSDPRAWTTQVTDRWGSRTIIEAARRRSGRARYQRSTDAAGRCRFGLGAGYWLIHLPARSGVAEVRQGRTTRVVAELPDTVLAVRGVVRNDAGAPLAGASIWTSNGPDESTSWRLAQADDAGRFRALVAAGTILVARAPGKRPAAWRVEPAAVAAREIDFVVQGQGIDVHGTVRDRDGRPLADAQVVLGARHDLLEFEAQDGLRRVHGAPVGVVTDRHGRFVVPGADPGAATLRVAAPGHGQVVAQVELAPDRDPLTIELPRAGSIAGVVTAANGAPLPDVRVVVGRSTTEFEAVATTTDDDGRFQLVDVGPGTVPVTAHCSEHGRAQTVLELAGGDTATWRAVLSTRSRQITGRVLGATPPRARQLVVVRDDSARRAVAEIAADGSFVFEVDDFDLHKLSALLVYERGTVDERGRAAGFALARRAAVAPGSTDVELTLPAASARRGAVHGFAVADDARQLGKLSLHGDCPGDRVVLATLETVGVARRFAAADLPAGTYTLRLGGSYLGEFTITRHEEVDLGLVRPRPGLHGAALRVLSFPVPAGLLETGRLLVEVRTARGDVALREQVPCRHGAWRLPLQLAAGRYRVLASEANGWRADVGLLLTSDEPSPTVRRITLAR